LSNLIQSIKELGYAVKLDTNGTHPEKLQNLIDQNLLDYVAMDIKNSPDRYKETTRQPNLNLSSIEKSVSLLNSGIIESEFRTTVIKEFHDENAFHAIGKLIKGAKNYYLQPFVDRDTVPDHNLHAPTKQELQNYAKIMENYVENVSIRGI
jgi:pyruvate formate lyase activating enzyme